MNMPKRASEPLEALILLGGRLGVLNGRDRMLFGGVDVFALNLGEDGQGFTERNAGYGNRTSF